jgi:hypothetical protein
LLIFSFIADAKAAAVVDQKAAKSSKQVGKGKEGGGVVTKDLTSSQQASSMVQDSTFSDALGMPGTIHEFLAIVVY